MPAALIAKDEVLARLLATFRSDGYDGASLAELSQRTGLGKSSLYHHFPGGKEEMATSVLAYLEDTLEPAFQRALSGKTAGARLARMLDTIDDFYAGGKAACLLERLAASVDRACFKKPLARAFQRFMAVFAEIGCSAGLQRDVAQARAEDAVVRIEGALVVASGTGDVKVFQRALAEIRSTFLEQD
jgi:TetR/AcrR family transcriptional repressor of lmrAB and yxaGH operons